MNKPKKCWLCGNPAFYIYLGSLQKIHTTKVDCATGDIHVHARCVLDAKWNREKIREIRTLFRDLVQ